MVGKSDPTGQDRSGRNRGKPLACQSTLNRLASTPRGAKTGRRYQKIVARHSELEQSFLEIFIEQHTQLRRARTFATHPREIAFHLDATDGPVHGHQRGRFFQGSYRTYCFRPLDIFCGQNPLCAMLRPADSDGSAGSLLRVKRRVTRLRQAWPDVVITLRADSGFCRDNHATTKRRCETCGLAAICRKLCCDGEDESPLAGISHLIRWEWFPK